MAARGEKDMLAVVDACQAAALDLGSWPDALASVAAMTGSRSGQLIGFGSAVVTNFNWITDVDQEWLTEFSAAGGTDPAHNPRLAAGMRTPAMQPLTDAGLVSARERRRSFIYTELASQDVPFICATSLIKNSERNVGLAVLRSHSQGEIDPEQLRSFAAIAPLARSAVRTQEALEGRAAQLLSGALEALALPVFICNAAGRVCAMTLGAEALVSGRNGIALKQGWLRLERADETRNLTTAIQRAALGISQPTEPLLATLLAQREACAPLVLDVISLPRRPYSFGFEPRVLVVARSSQPDLTRSRLLLQAAYGLTLAEADVALQLASGQSPEAIALARSVSIGTVRAQIRAAYTKLDVGRQIELVARLRELACI